MLSSNDSEGGGGNGKRALVMAETGTCFPSMKMQNAINGGKVEIDAEKDVDKNGTDSFLEVLKASAKKNAKKTFATWYDSKGKATESYSYQDIWEAAGFIAHYLRIKKEVAKGDRVILCYSPGLDFFAAFFGCLRAGVVAVPIYPPDPRKFELGLRKMELVHLDCDAKLILTDSKVEKMLMIWKLQNVLSHRKFKALFQIHPKVPKKAKADVFQGCEIYDDDLAFLQYTSGSTGDPKGVLITHRALRANCISSIEALGGHAERVGVAKDDLVGFSWLPQYHDMGLIFATVAPFVGGWRCNMISPMDFLFNPLIWIELISKLKVHWSIAPNFAYQLVARKFLERQSKNHFYGNHIDLSSIIQLGNAAEPIQVDTKHMFDEVFARFGLQENWFCAGYGLAESVACVSTLHRLKVSNDERFVAVAKRGNLHDGQVIKIVCPDTEVELPEGETGEIWISGPSVAVGYWGKPELSKETFEGRVSSDNCGKMYLRTGDLGFFENEYLYVCGRLKDLIIVNGRNHYPTDIEIVVQNASRGVRPGCVAAFSSDDCGGSGELEIVFEIRKEFEKGCKQIIDAIHDAVVDIVDLTPKRIVAIKERLIMKTTSGKIQRRANRKALHGGVFQKHIIFDSKNDNQIIFSKHIHSVSRGTCDVVTGIESGKCAVFDSKHDKDLEHLTESSWLAASQKSAFLATKQIFSNEDKPEKSGAIHLDDDETKNPEFTSRQALDNVTSGDDTILDKSKELPHCYQSLPIAAVLAIEQISSNEAKLEKIFSSFRVDKLPGVKIGWGTVDKSTEALQSMCKRSLAALVLPMIQFGHLLSSNIEEWLLISDGSGLLSDVVHTAFVLDWITKVFVNDSDIFEEKMKADENYERKLLEDVDLTSTTAVPEELRFLIDGQRNDQLWGAVDVFGFLKMTSVRKGCKLLLATSKNLPRDIKGKIHYSVFLDFSLGGDSWLKLNILEASWVDYLHDRQNNLFVGQWLAASTQSLCSNMSLEQNSQDNMYWSVYVAWDTALMASFPDPDLTLAKLLMPCHLENVSGGYYSHYRTISLYLVLQMSFERKMNHSTMPRAFSDSAVLEFGELNKKWLSHLYPNIDVVDDYEQSQSCKKWMGLFNKCLSEKSLRDSSRCCVRNTVELESKWTKEGVAMEVESAVKQTLKTTANIDHSVNLMDIGITSMTISELAFHVESRFGIQLSPTSFFSCPTVDGLSCHIYNALSADDEFFDLSETHTTGMSVVSRQHRTSVLDSLEESDSLTQNELRLLYLHLSYPSSNSYNIPFLAQFHQDVDLKSVTAMVVESLPILCTRFVNGKAISDCKPIIEDVTTAEKGGMDAILFAPFDLQVGPLCRFGVDRTNNLLIGCIHHSIVDGRSMNILLDAIASGRVKNSSVMYSVRKYAAYESLPEMQDQYRTSLETWQHILNDTPPRLEVDFISSTSVPHRSNVKLDRETISQLKTLCRNEGVSMFVLALSALHHSMRAYSHEPFSVGVAYDSRPFQFRDSIGMFVNTVLVPFAGGKKGGTKTLQHLQNFWSNSIIPLAKTPYDLIANMGYGCNVYLAFNVGITDEGDGNSVERDKDYHWEQIQSERFDPKFDLSVTWSDDMESGGFVVSFESSIGPWPGLEERFMQVLNGYIEGIHKESSLSSILPWERVQVLQWGKGEVKPAKESCLHEMFEKQAQLRPDAIALWDKNCSISMTYGELDRASTCLALELQQLGAKPNTFVGLLTTGKSFELYVAVLGVLKSGAAYVPMDAELIPGERIKFIVEDTNMSVLVTSKKHVEVANALGVDTLKNVVYVENVSETILQEDLNSKPSLLKRIVKCTDHAYMIYTSGTTGKPKGVICNHIGPVNMIDFDGIFGLGIPEKDVVGCSVPVIFDVFVEGCFGALGNGLSLSLDQTYCTMVFCTPSVAFNILDDKSNNHVRCLSVGGEACIGGLESKCEIFRNVYGPTECSICSCASAKSSTIGKPFPNVQFYVVHSEDGKLCPPGVSGELWIGGIGVSLGYHNRPELTAEKFIPNPFDASGKVYKTGDRVKWNEDGELMYLGRFDHQVKVRGYRIELGEIQTELEKQTSVTGSLVMVYEGKLVAYVTVNDISGGEEVEKAGRKKNKENQLKAELESGECKLPSYMVPWKIIVLENFPLTQNGKIAREKLPAPALNTDAEHYVSPQTSSEIFLCNLYAEILCTENIGIDCDFIKLGGHSLQIMQAVMKIRNHFNIDTFSVRQFAELKTPRNIGKHIDELVMVKDSLGACFDENHQEHFDGMTGTVLVQQPSTSKLSMKFLGVIVLSMCITIPAIPASIVFSNILSHQSFSTVWSSHDYCSFIVACIASILVLFGCMIGINWVVCILLRQHIGTKSRIIKCNSTEYALWYVFDRLWFITRKVAVSILSGTLFLPWFYQKFGANIGSRNFFEDTEPRLPFMLTTGNNVVVEAGAKLETISILTNEDIVVGELALGDNVVVGPNSHIGLGAKLGKSSQVKALSFVADGCSIPQHATVEGNKTKPSHSTIGPNSVLRVSEDHQASLRWHVLFLAIMHLPTILFWSFVFAVCFGVLQLCGGKRWLTALVSIIIFPFFVPIGQLIIGLFVHVLRALLNGGKAKPGHCRLYSKLFLKQQLASRLFKSITCLNKGTFFSRFTGRLLGARLDIYCSFTPLPEEPDLTTTGKNVFAANGVMLRNTSYFPGGSVEFGRVDVGDSSMLLDRAIINPNTRIKSNVVIGSITHLSESVDHSDGGILMGNPALQIAGLSNEVRDHQWVEIKGESTNKQLMVHFVTAYFHLVIRISTMAAIYSSSYLYLWMRSGENYSQCFALIVSSVVLPISLAALCAWMLVLGFLSKWLMVGSFCDLKSNGALSMDSWKSFRWLVSNYMVHMSCNAPLQIVDEFWLTAFFWKTMGAAIGRGTKIDPDVLLFEADLLEVGEMCRIEDQATLFCHKFINGGLEVAPISLPSNTYIGSRAVILPGCKIDGENITIMPLTPVNPGEVLTVGTWQGSPAEMIEVEGGLDATVDTTTHSSRTISLSASQSFRRNRQ